MNALDDHLGAVVSVHLNLTTHRFVIAPKPRARVLGYAAHDVTLRDVTFKVSEAQRQYCIAKGGRWVHAWAVGTLEGIDTYPQLSGLVRVTYNPFRAPRFHVADTGEEVETAARVTFCDRYSYISA